MSAASSADSQGSQPSAPKATAALRFAERTPNITDPSNGAAPPLVTFKGLTLTGGDSSSNGGAINSRAMLSIIDCAIEGNEGSPGGGVFVQVAGNPTLSREVRQDRLLGIPGEWNAFAALAA